jgi:flagellar protein FliS
MNAGINAYKKNQINTISSEQLVLMLYEGACKFIGRAVIAMENKDIAGANHDLIRSQEILAELMRGINFDAGTIATNLYDLYEFMYRQLIQANIKKDPQLAVDVLEMINELKDAWQQILRSPGQRGAVNSA